MNIKDNIQKHIHELAKEIREYSISQKDDWQKIPWLALNADGRGGYSSGYRFAYEIGVWNIKEGIFVNLENGKLVSIPFNPKPNCECEELENYSILKIADFVDETLNAKKVIQTLEESILMYEDTPYYGEEDFKSNVEWRNSIIQKYNLKKDFYRRMK